MNVFFLVSSLWAFLSFYMLAFVGFLLLCKDAIFMSSRFFQTTSDSHGTLHLALGLVGMHSAAAFMWTVTYFSFRVCVSDISWKASNLLLIFLLVRTSHNKWFWLLFLYPLRCILAVYHYTSHTLPVVETASLLLSQYQTEGRFLVKHWCQQFPHCARLTGLKVNL